MPAPSGRSSSFRNGWSGLRPRIPPSAWHLVADNKKFLQPGGAKVRGERDIGGVATAGHHNAADSGNVVAGIKRVTASAEI